MSFFEDTTNKEINNSLWVEKYRPQVLKEYVGNEHLKSKVEGYLESGDIPHISYFLVNCVNQTFQIVQVKLHLFKSHSENYLLLIR